ncbi:MAG: transcriptional regulator, partial [Gammaproteobacteria bacterium]|nr:transcriptional regulator [Gammaproteobacteria bacterium]
WLRHEREQMHQTALEAMSTVTQNHLKGDRPELALAVARQQLSLEPWRESAYRQLMTAYALAGDRGNALAQFEQCREVLWEELGVEPAVETVNLYESIKLGDYVPISEDRILEAPDEVRSNLPAYTTPLIGREAEIASLSDFIMEPNIYLITIVGPGGIGKTRLAIAAAERALTTGNFQEGSFFIDLVPLQEAGQILPTLAETLNYP